MRSFMAPGRRGSKTAKKQIGPTPANGNLAPVIAMSVPAINATERSRCNTETTTLRERQRALPRPIKWAPKSNMPSGILRRGLSGGVPKGGNCYPGETWRRRASTTSVHAGRCAGPTRGGRRMVLLELQSLPQAPAAARASSGSHCSHVYDGSHEGAASQSAQRARC